MTTTTVRDVGELLAILPYQFGFDLARCLVCVTVTNGRIGPLQRLDIPDDPKVGFDNTDTSASLRCLRTHGGAVLLVVYEDVPGQGTEALRQFEDMCAEAQVTVLDVLVVRGGSWWSLSQIPWGEGAPVPHRADVPAALDFVAAGISPLPSRESIADLLASRRGDLTGVSRDLRRRRRAGASGEADTVSAWAAVLTPHRLGRVDSQSLGANEIAAAIHSLDDPFWRDAVIAWLAPDLFGDLDLEAIGAAALVRAVGRPALGSMALGPPLSSDVSDPQLTPVGRSGRLEQRLFDLVASTPRGDQAPVSSVLGAFLWAQGRGAFAETALRHALTERPDYRLARLLYALVQSGRPGPTLAR